MNKSISVLLASVSLGNIWFCPAESSANDRIRKVGYGHLGARALHIAAYYKLFDTLEKGPKKAEQMVPRDQSDAVKRLMRVLANHEIVGMDDQERFSLNNESRLLVSTQKGSLQPAMAKEFNLKRWEAIGNIHLLMEKDVSSFEQLFNESYYAYLAGNKEASEAFNQGMKNFSETEDAEVSGAFPFQDFKTYCDIGGGTGGLIMQILDKSPKLNASLLELQETLAQCKEPKFALAPGSFFRAESIPSSEIYTVKRVLHNWKDPESVEILTNIRTKLSDLEKGRILVIERVVPITPDGTYLGDSDVIGMALGGRERTLEEFKNLGHKAGLELEKTLLLKTGVSILVFKSK